MSATNRRHALIVRLLNYCDGSLGNSVFVEIFNDICTDYADVLRKLTTSTRADNGDAMRRGTERGALLYQLIGRESVREGKRNGRVKNYTDTAARRERRKRDGNAQKGPPRAHWM